MDSREKEQWRMMAAMFAMNGLISAGQTDRCIPEIAFRIADDMMEQAEQNTGIVTVKKRGRK